jgi:Domain of unknown function (DUF5668)
MDPQTTEEQSTRTVRPGPIMAGLVLLSLGAAMLVDLTGIVELHSRQLVGPFILIAMGAAIVLEKRGGVPPDAADSDSGRRLRRRRRDGGTGGFWLIGVGAWMLISQSHLFGLSFHSSWPILLVMAGALMVIRGIR